MPSTAIDLQSRPRLGARVRLQMDPVKDEPVLLYPEGLLQLNATAHEVVRRCDGEATVAQILDSLGEEYEVEPETLREDVVACLAQLAQRQMIVFAP